MTHFTRLLLLAFVLLFACPAPTTSVRLRLQYDESWPLTAFVLTARDKTVRLHASSADGTKTREFVVSIPHEWVGEAVTYTVRAYVSAPPTEELYASGHTTVIAIEGEVTDDVIVFARSACATWCTPGSTFCRNGGVMVCEMSETGCPRWGTPSLCSDGQSCSLGECNTQCVNECAEGETRCSGPLGVEICGQSDDDACLDWQQPILCEGAQICSNGRCSDSCMSECTAGSVRCRDGGLSTCADSNSDGCLEWGPSVSCAAGESCTGNEGMPDAVGVAHCQARTSCMDSCTANTCANNTFTTCGNFNLDSCREPSAGTNCASANPCEEGVCDLTANGGMGGCVTRPLNTAECAGPTTCSELSCGVLPQCGCSAGQACYLDEAGARRICDQVGVIPVGSLCPLETGCVPGADCFAYDSLGLTVCLEFCRTNSDCHGGPGASCQTDIGHPNLRTCTLDCDVMTGARCPSGTRCRLVLSTSHAGYTNCAHPTASGEQGAACTTDDECAQGYACHERICKRWCEPSIPGNCPSRTQCATFEGVSPFVGRFNGVCHPAP